MQSNRFNHRRDELQRQFDAATTTSQARTALLEFLTLWAKQCGWHSARSPVERWDRNTRDGRVHSLEWAGGPHGWTAITIGESLLSGVHGALEPAEFNVLSNPVIYVESDNDYRVSFYRRPE